MDTSLRQTRQFRYWGAAALLTILTSCQTPNAPEDALVIENVTVLSMVEGAAPLEDMDVVISQGRITQVAQDVRIGPGAERIDGQGRYLLPGLTDMHTHPENAGILRKLSGVPGIPDFSSQETEDVFLPFVANGVTQIVNMSANGDSVAQRDAIERGDVLGPHMLLAAMVDGAPSLSPFSTEVGEPEAGAEFVRNAHGAGHDFIKVYSQLDAPTFDAIMEEAMTQKMRVIGHIPGRGMNTPERFLQPEFVMVGHAEEFAFQGGTVAESRASIPAYVALMRRNGVQLTSTLTLDERIVEQARRPDGVSSRKELRYLSPGARAFWTQANPYAAQGPQYADFVASIVAFNAALVKACYEAGVPVLPGTDANVPGVAPGFSLHDELEALARAGLPNTYVLESATRRSAEFLGVSGDRGTIEVGKRADLLLLEADPMVDIANTRRIAAVILNGRVLTADELASRMEALAVRRADPPAPD
jgi:cytosine/adenosine deaminase-related metal-dependent hydrolase